jgi:CheY-like chemotaxis protein
MPEMDGWELCRRLRQSGDLPLLILTARGETNDKVKGFQLGIDDFPAPESPNRHAELSALPGPDFEPQDRPYLNDDAGVRPTSAGCRPCTAATGLTSFPASAGAW